MAGRPTVLLDRDGTLNVERSFIRTPDQLQILPGAREAVARLHRRGYRLIVLTNQSGVARGLYTEQDLARVHEVLQEEFGGLLSAVLHSPHHPDCKDSPYGWDSHYRKPGSGLVLQADRLFGIPWERSFVVGDSARDLLPGRDLPLRRVLVQSGKPWEEQLALLRKAELEPALVCADLGAAADWILSQDD